MYPRTRITFVEAMGEVPGATPVGANGTPGSTEFLGYFRDDEKREDLVMDKRRGGPSGPPLRRNACPWRRDR